MDIFLCPLAMQRTLRTLYLLIDSLFPLNPILPIIWINFLWLQRWFPSLSFSFLGAEITHELTLGLLGSTLVPSSRTALSLPLSLPLYRP